MKRGFKILIAGCVFLAFSNSCAKNTKSTSQKCQLAYKFKNPSLGPVNGVQALKIHLADNQIVSATNTKTGKSIPIKSIRGKKYFLKALSHKNNNIEVQYDSDGFPVRITNKVSKQKLGGKFFIEISQYHCK